MRNHLFVDRGVGTRAYRRVQEAAQPCPNCGTEFTFPDGFRCAGKMGIRANVVACPSCKHVYTCVFNHEGLMVPNEDVTDQYKK